MLRADHQGQAVTGDTANEASRGSHHQYASEHLAPVIQFRFHSLPVPIRDRVPLSHFKGGTSIVDLC